MTLITALDPQTREPIIELEAELQFDATPDGIGRGTLTSPAVPALRSALGAEFMTRTFTLVFPGETLEGVCITGNRGERIDFRYSPE